MKIQIRIVDNVNIIDIEGKIDVNSIQIIEVISELLKYKKAHILCNMEEVESIDYNGLTILAISYKNVINRSGKMKFCNVPNHVLSLFKVAHLDEAFEIYDDEKIAVRSFLECTSRIDKQRLRRRFNRLDISLDIKYGLLARPAKLYEGKLVNISGAGIYVQTKDTFPLKTKLKLIIDLPNADKPIEAAGVAVWEADREIQPQAYPGMGIQFAYIPSNIQKIILDFVDKHRSRRSGSGLQQE